MAYSEQFWQGVGSFGSGAGGLYGAYCLAASWGATSSVSGLLAGAAGILVGGLVGAIVGAFAFTAAIFVLSVIVDSLASNCNNLIEGTGMVLGS